MARKSWVEKLAGDEEPVVKPAPKDFADIKAGQLMLLTTPRQLDDFIKQLPAGVSLDMKTLRARLAAAVGAEMACPVVTGINLRTVAEVATAQLDAGADPQAVTPVWRVIEPGAPITKKLELGALRLMELRKSEGLSV